MPIVYICGIKRAYFHANELCTAKKILEYSIFIRISKQFIEMPYFKAIMTNKCPNMSMKTHRARISSSLSLFVPICTRITGYTNHVASDLIFKPARINDKSQSFVKTTISIAKSNVPHSLNKSLILTSMAVKGSPNNAQHYKTSYKAAHKLSDKANHVHIVKKQ